MSGSTRTIALTFDSAGSNPSSAPFEGQTLNVAPNMISDCSANNTLDFGTMTTAGQTLQCPMQADFTYGGSPYRLRMDPSKWAGSSWVLVTCTGAQLSLCNSWAVGPGNGFMYNGSQYSAVGELIQVSSGKGKTTYTPLGLYYVAFGITITKP